MERYIGLGYLSFAHQPGSLPGGTASGSRACVDAEPARQEGVQILMPEIYRPGYAYNPVDQFRMFQVGDFLPAAEELFARERIAFEERWSRKRSKQPQAVIVTPASLLLMQLRR